MKPKNIINGYGRISKFLPSQGYATEKRVSLDRDFTEMMRGLHSQDVRTMLVEAMPNQRNGTPKALYANLKDLERAGIDFAPFCNK